MISDTFIAIVRMSFLLEKKKKKKDNPVCQVIKPTMDKRDQAFYDKMQW
jgi:hypothetical protein